MRHYFYGIPVSVMKEFFATCPKGLENLLAVELTTGRRAPGQQETGEADQRGDGAESLQPECGQQGNPQQDQAAPLLAGHALTRRLRGQP